MKLISMTAAAAAMAFGLVASGAATAKTIFSSFGPGQTYDPANGVLEAGIGNTVSHHLAYTLSSFVAANSGLVDVVHAPVHQFTSAGANAVVLYSDTVVGAKHQPDPHSSPLAPFVPATFAPLGISSSITAPISGPTDIETFTFLANVSLVAGQTYWIGMITDATTAANWLDSPTHQAATFCSSFGPVPVALTNFGCALPNTNIRPAFDIIARTAVPEPSTISLIGAGLAGMLTVRRRRKA